MGLIAMLVSFVIGIFLIIFGITHRKNNQLNLILAVIGVACVLLAIYLGLPK